MGAAVVEYGMLIALLAGGMAAVIATTGVSLAGVFREAGDGLARIVNTGGSQSGDCAPLPITASDQAVRNWQRRCGATEH